jgi:hypothetical protein
MERAYERGPRPEPGDSDQQDTGPYTGEVSDTHPKEGWYARRLPYPGPGRPLAEPRGSGMVEKKRDMWGVWCHVVRMGVRDP